MQSIHSGAELRKVLGPDVVRAIRGYDTEPLARRLMRSLRKQVIATFGASCGWCGQVRTVELAHIVSVQVGGTTEAANVLLLCSDCHQAYDNHGAVSIDAMQRAAECWRAHQPLPHRGVPLACPPKATVAVGVTTPPDEVAKVMSDVRAAQAKRHFLKAQRTLERAVADQRHSLEAAQYLSVVRVELSRRRGVAGGVERALELAGRWDLERFPAWLLPLACYEQGYALRLAGRHGDATEWFRKSAAAIPDRQGSVLARVAAMNNVVLCLIAQGSVGSAEARDALRGMYHDASLVGGFWGARWASNCAGHEVVIALRSRDLRIAREALERFRVLYYASDATSGWALQARALYAQIVGLYYAMNGTTEDELRLGLSLLARFLISRLGGIQRIEGVRDAGFAFAMALTTLDDPASEGLAATVRSAISRVSDGTSLIWPTMRDEDHIRR